MSSSNIRTVKFEQKFLRSWAILGAIVGLIFAIIGLIGGIAEVKIFGIFSIFTFPIGGALWAISQGGLGMLFDAAARHNWKFEKIEHQPWVWHIYPIVGILDIAFSFTIGFLWHLVTGKFK